jgi:RNA polymerase sigma-70 factor, ECF subfamily
MSSTPTPLEAALAGSSELMLKPAAPLPAAPPAAVRGESREERLAELLSGWFRMVWRALRRFGVPAAAADDAAQEVFIIAARKLDQIEHGRERQFLYGVAIRVAANARRARAARPETAASDGLDDQASVAPNPEALLDRKQAREQLERILEAMPEDLRTAFVLFELEGCSAPEVAELLQIPVGTASSRLRRAREAFQASVAELRAKLARGAKS